MRTFTSRISIHKVRGFPHALSLRGIIARVVIALLVAPLILALITLADSANATVGTSSGPRIATSTSGVWNNVYAASDSPLSTSNFAAGIRITVRVTNGSIRLSTTLPSGDSAITANSQSGISTTTTGTTEMDWWAQSAATGNQALRTLQVRASSSSAIPSVELGAAPAAVRPSASDPDGQTQNGAAFTNYPNPVYVVESDSWFQLINRNGTNWTTARDAAAGLAALNNVTSPRLASLETAEQSRSVRGLLKGTNTQVYLGAADDNAFVSGSSENNWRWLDGNAWSWTTRPTTSSTGRDIKGEWQTYEPNSDAQDCLQIDWSWSSSGYWDDLQCDFAASWYVAEYGGAGSSTTYFPRLTSTQTITFTNDSTAPTVAITRSGSGPLRSGQTATLTFTLSEAASDFAVSDITVSGGALSSFTSTSSTVYTAVFTPNTNTQTGSGSISVGAGVFSDAAGNTNTASTATSISYDTLAPTISLSGCASSYAAGTSCTITITLSDNVSDLTLSDFNTTRGTLSSLTASGLTRTVSFTPAGSESSNGSVLVAVGSITDSNGNTNAASNTLTITISAPSNRTVISSATATGTSVTAGTSGASRYVIHTYQTAGSTSWIAPKGVTSVNYLVVAGGGGGGNGWDNSGGAGGGAGMMQSSTVSVTPGDSYTVVVGAGGSGGVSVRSTQNGTNGSSSQFGSIISTGGQAGGGSRGNMNGSTEGAGGAAQNGTTTSARGGNGGTGGARGGGGGGTTGNGSAGSSGGASGLGTSSSISGVASTYGAGGSGAAAGVSSTGASGTSNSGNGGGGGGGAVASSSAGGTGGSGLVIVRYALPATSEPNLIDSSDSGISTTDNITSNQTLTFTGASAFGSVVQLSTAPQGTSPSSGSWTDTGASCTTDPNSGEWSCTTDVLTPGSYAVRASSTTYLDDETFTETSSTALNITIDTTAPTVTSVAFSSDAGSDNTYKINDVINVTVTFTENVNVTGAPQIALAGLTSKFATYTSGTGTSALLFSYSVASNDIDSDGLAITANTLALNGGTIADTSSNNATLTHSAIATQATQKVEGVPPTIALSGCTAPYVSGSTCTISITLNETTSDLTLDDFSVTRGSLSALTTSGTSRTVTFTASGNTSGTGTVSVAASRFTDAFGNDNTASNSLTINFAASTTTLLSSATQTGALVADGTSGSSKYIVRTFTEVANATWTVPQGVTSVDYLVVGGGGGGGAHVGGGGGAGGVRTGTLTGLTSGSPLSVAVGAGGTGATGGTHNCSDLNLRSKNGGNSSLSTVTSSGGGGGGSWTYCEGLSGGSGGGGGSTSNGGTGTSGQGNNGGGGNGGASGNYTGGGGGGAASGGGVGGASTGGTGGTGVSSSITGSSLFYGGGGGGGVHSSPGTAGLGGSSVGGSGTVYAYRTKAGNGQANTGSGGGGAGYPSGEASSSLGGDGGSGIVVIRYLVPAPTTPDLSVTSDGGVSTSDNITSNQTLTFTGTAAMGASVQLSYATASSTSDISASTGSWTNTGSACSADTSTGAWSCVTAELSPGLYKFRSVATTQIDGVTDTQTSSSGLPATIDTTAPTVSLTRTVSGTLKSGQTDTITFTLSEAATDFAVGDITVSGGTLSSFTATSSTVYTVIFTPTASTATGSGSISVAGATFTDAAANNNTASSATTISYDTLVPTVSLVRTGSGTLKSGQTDTITFTLSEAATDFAVGDITVSGGTLSSFTATSSTVYTVIFTPTASTQSGSGSISVAGATFTDAAGNSNTASSATTISYDTLAPTVSLVRTGSGTLKSGQTDTITFTLSEAATDFAVGDITVTGGTLSSFTATSSTVYTVIFTPTADTASGSGSVSVAGATFTDAAGNSNTASSATTISYDTLVPTVSLVRTGSGTLKSGQTDTITFTLSEAATDFAVGDITVSGGTLSSFTATSATVYSVIFTPTADTATGSGSISVAGATFTDAAGNSNTASIATTISYDTLAPTVSLVRTGSGTLKSGQTDTITITFSETGLFNGITVSGGTLSSFTATSSTVYTVIFTPTASTATGSGSLSVLAADFTDYAGNTNAASNVISITYDTLAPTATVSRTYLLPIGVRQNITITFTLSEASSTFTAADITVTGGSIGSLTTVSSTVYQVLFTPTADTNSGTSTLSVAAAKFTDSAGNDNTASNTLSIPFDTREPTVAITRAGSTSLRSGQTDIITFTLSEASNTFIASDITVTGGSIGALTTTSSTVYSVVFTPVANTQSGTGSISVAAGRFTDPGGNGNIASSTRSVPYDTLAATISNVNSSTANGTLGIGSSVSIQITFSEAVTVSGTPQLTLETGTTDRTASYASGSGTSTLTFTYTVQSGDTSGDLDYASTSALALNGGTIVDSVGNTATLTLPAPGTSGSLGANMAILVASEPTQIVSARTPAGTASGAAFTTQPRVSLQDNGGSIVTSDNTTVVTATVGTGAALVGTRTATAVNGVVTFDNLGISGTVGTAYIITYSATVNGNALTVATQSVTPTLGAATQISITTQPVGDTAGALLSTQPVVKVLDSGNNLVTSATTAINVTSSGGTLGGTQNVDAVNGVATFGDLTFAGTSSTNYALTFTTTSLGSAVSSNFTVGVGAATKLVRTTNASGAVYDTQFTTQPVLEIRDAGNNKVSSATNVVTATLSSGTIPGTTDTTLTATAASGVATFSGLGITGTPGDYTITYSSGALTTASQSITLVKASQTITFTDPTDRAWTAAAIELSPTATSGLTVTLTSTSTDVCTVSDLDITMMKVGTCSLTASQSGNSFYNAATSVSHSFDISQASQSISFDAITNRPWSASTFDVSPTATSGLTVTVTSVTTSVCSVSNTTVSMLKAGTCELTAAQSGSTNYSAATSVPQSFEISRATQASISITSLTATYEEDLSLTTLGGSGSGAVTYTKVSGDCTLLGGALTPTAAGSCEITATKAADTQYASASVTSTITINKANQSVALTLGTTSVTYGQTLTLAGSGGEGNGAISYSVSEGTCTLNTAVLTPGDAGSVCKARVTRAESSNYNSLTSAPIVITVMRATPTLGTLALSTKTFGDAAFALTGPSAIYDNASVAGAWSYSSAQTSVATIEDSTATITGGGTSVITATFSPTDSVNYNSANTASTLTVEKATPTFSWSNVLATYGDADFTIVSPAVATTAATGTWSYASATTSVIAISGTNFDVVNAGSSVITATFTPSNTTNYVSGETTTMTVTVQRANQAALTISSTSGTYGTDLTLTTAGGTTDGTITWGVSNDSATGCAISSGKLATTSIGTCTVTATMAGNDNYNSVANSGTTVTINAKPITVTAVAKTKTYGDSDPTLTFATATGALVGSDTLTGTLTRVTGDTVGEYTINQGTVDNSNYDISYTSAKLTINAKPITVTATAKTKIYGASDPALTYTTAVGALVGSDTLTGTLTRVTGDTVGEYTINQGTVDNSNYDISYTSAKLTINAKPITVTATAKTKIYGASDPALTYTTATGALVGSDTLTGTLARVTGDTVGEYTINQGTVDNSNYDISYTSAKLTINAKPITVTAVAKTKTYGDTDPALTYTTAVGALVGSDTLSGSLTRDAGEDANSYTIRRGTVANTNYDITYIASTLTITQAQQSALSVTTANIVYRTPITLQAAGGSEGDLSFNVASSGTASCSIEDDTLFASGNAGSTCTVTATRAMTNNYVQKTSSPFTITVVPRTITLTATAKEKFYGDSDPGLTYVVTAGSLFGSDTFAGTQTRASGENVGTYTINKGSLANSNYTVTYVPALLTINQRPITVTATNKTKIFAESDPLLSYTVTTGNIVGSDQLTGAITRAPGETLGSYNITRGTLDNGNYNITFISGTFRITGAQQTGFALTASSYSVVYNASITLQTSGGNGNGLVSYASQDGTGSCSISGDSVTGTTAGTCSVTATKAAEGGYLESTSNAITITIEKADQTILMSQMTDRDFSAAPITVAPASGSGSPVVLESRTPNVCAAEAFTISMRDSGVCSITASVAEGRNHNAAPSIIRSFEIRAVVPFAPAITSVAPSDATVTVTFTPGLSGGAAITTYRYSVDDGVRWTDLPDGTISSPIVIGNLPNDVEAKVRIMAVNRIGNGARSNMKAATPVAKKSMVWVTERQTNTEPATSATPSVGALSNQLPPSPALVRTQSVSGGRRTQVTATRSTKDANIPVTHAIITVRLKNGKLLARIQVLVDPNNPTTAVTVPYQSRRINVSVQFANNIGVSVGGTVGTNLRESSTFLETTINGRPRIAGTPIANSVSFAKGSSTLTTSAKAHLKKALKKAQAQGGLIYVTGYAQTGELQNSWILNALARERAKNVAQYFVSIGARQWITFYGAPITPTVWHNTPSGHVDIATVFPDQISNTSK